MYSIDVAKYTQHSLNVVDASRILDGELLLQYFNTIAIMML